MKLQYSTQHEKEYSIAHCTLYSEMDFKRYLAGAMSPNEQELFEQHCVGEEDEHACTDCASKLARVDKKQTHEEDLLNEERMIERIRQRTSELLEKLILP